MLWLQKNIMVFCCYVTYFFPYKNTEKKSSFSWNLFICCRRVISLLNFHTMMMLMMITISNPFFFLFCVRTTHLYHLPLYWNKKNVLRTQMDFCANQRILLSTYIIYFLNSGKQLWNNEDFFINYVTCWDVFTFYLWLIWVMKCCFYLFSMYDIIVSHIFDMH